MDTVLPGKGRAGKAAPFERFQEGGSFGDRRAWLSDAVIRGFHRARFYHTPQPATMRSQHYRLQ